ncbi:MAG: tetratricopeptide repeat protein [Acidobacteria bacterium]|nr:tetratricopeptide repeat protein [Acidobacteriota bacterium]
MKRLLMMTAALALLLTGCAAMKHRNTQDYTNPFYAKYLNPADPQDQQILRTMETLRKNPNSALAHNDLGQLLVQKRFPKDAEREFERAVDADEQFYPAWYNLALVREANGDYAGARHAFNRTVHYKPGNAEALFQLGLMEENVGNREEAIEHYAKAFTIKHALLDPRVNPRILDSRLIDLALIRAYPSAHTRQSMTFHPIPAGYVDRPVTQELAVSPQPPASAIVTPTAPVTDPGSQKTPKP